MIATYKLNAEEIDIGLIESIKSAFYGKEIIEFEQGGQLKAEYGKNLLSILSKDLSKYNGKWFSRNNLQYMRLLYNYYPKRMYHTSEVWHIYS